MIFSLQGPPLLPGPSRLPITAGPLDWVDQPPMQASREEDSDMMAHAAELMGLVGNAAEECKGEDNIWTNKRWTADFIAGVGGRILQYDSMTMMVPNSAGGEEARMVVYLHESE